MPRLISKVHEVKLNGLLFWFNPQREFVGATSRDGRPYAVLSSDVETAERRLAWRLGNTLRARRRRAAMRHILGGRQ